MAEQFKPKLRMEESLDINSAIRGMVKRVIQDEKHFPYRNCINCRYFTENTSYCKKWDARPPARVICFGCDSHDDVNEIPF